MPKKDREILVWGKFYPFLFPSILCYFISWESFNIFSWNFVQLYNIGIILVVNNWWSSAPDLLGAILEYFGGLFWHMYLFFLISVQYFVIQFCSGGLEITLIATNTFFKMMFPSSGGHFRLFWDIFWHITSTFWEPFNMVYEILYRRSCCFFWGSLHHFFHIMTFLGSLFGVFLA